MQTNIYTSEWNGSKTSAALDQALIKRKGPQGVTAGHGPRLPNNIDVHQYQKENNNKKLAWETFWRWQVTQTVVFLTVG